ncbi:MAG: hypothetical protein PHZ07_03640 [Patescibacteria group bacterium]|nr:hypothetical protein [Patescibacteria group bacterium]MDD4304456.1 hypothetical protein [Patescibacteria group bacterium]MDD4695478.1 hypothetical protein [Patescibacteria group bacterium]
MDFKVKVLLSKNINDVLRDCGYRLHPKYGDSYIKRLSSISYYPRLHLYLKEKENIYNFSLHLDQKKVSYKGQRAHSGDYDDVVIEKEAERIISILSKNKK